ncbi:MAG: hypothetical protein NVS3B23_08890 [Candidatus Saccharimonadales bacterium]
MNEGHKSTIIESMAPLWMPDKDTEIIIISRPDFAYILKTAIESDNYGPVIQSTIQTSDYMSVERLRVMYRSEHQLIDSRKVRQQAGLYSHLPPRIAAVDMQEYDKKTADTTPRRLGRLVLQKIGIRPPKLFETKWSRYNQLQNERRLNKSWYLQAGDIIDYTGERNERLVFVADDSEFRFSKATI